MAISEERFTSSGSVYYLTRDPETGHAADSFGNTYCFPTKVSFVHPFRGIVLYCLIQECMVVHFITVEFIADIEKRQNMQETIVKI